MSWGVEELKAGMYLLQGPEGLRTYLVKELREKDFVLKNCESGQIVFENYQWLCMYRVVDPPAKFEKETV